MSHNLMNENAYAGREPGWHKLGTVNPAGWPTAVAAFEAGHLNYRVEKFPLRAEITTPFGIQLVDTGKFGIFREPVEGDQEWRFFGAVSDQYVPLQNMAIAELIDSTGLAESWPVETVGALGHGENSFVCLDMGEQLVGGHESEKVHKYFAIHDSKDATSGLKAMFTPVRIVCQNTLIMGTKAATALSWFRHGEQLSRDLEYRMKMLHKLTQISEQSMGMLDFMAATILSSDDVEQVLERSYPMPSKPRKAALLDAEFSDKEIFELASVFTEASNAATVWEQQCENVMELRGAAGNLFQKFNDEQPVVANTAWAAYNAVVEFEDFIRQHKEGLDPAQTIFGWKANIKSRAYESCLALALNK